MNSAHEYYRHRQFGWMLIAGVMLPAGFLAFLLPHATGRAAQLLPAAMLPVVFCVCLLVAIVFGALEVRVTSEALEWRFGVGLLHGKVGLAEVASVKATRTSFATGWGMRKTPRGWLYNVAGFDAIELVQKSGRSLLIGTDQPVALRLALEKALAAHTGARHTG